MPASKRPFHRASDNLMTYRLKWAAWEWLYSEAKCRAIGFEVRLEGPGGRVVDVVGVGPDNRVYAIEVKASRGDKARDDHNIDDLKRLQSRVPVMDKTVQFTVGVLEAAAEYAVSSGVKNLDLIRLIARRYLILITERRNGTLTQNVWPTSVPSSGTPVS